MHVTGSIFSFERGLVNSFGMGCHTLCRFSISLQWEGGTATI